MSVEDAPSYTAPRFADEARHYDALLVLSFGGPEGMDDVIPFLENVTRGRNIPRERLEQVAQHYYHFGGVSPITQQNRDLIAALDAELKAHEIHLPIYFGNRNWAPYVTDTVRQMQADGVRRALVFATSAFSSYSGCRQYREDLLRAIAEIGNVDIEFDKLRVFYNHPGYIGPLAEKIREARATFPAERRSGIEVVFTAHSIPLTMARSSAYEAQFREASHLVAILAGLPRYRIAYQSRSGAPHIPWLEPDILAEMDTLHAAGKNDLIIAPIGFISDHMEVRFDLDEEAKQHAAELGMTMVRAATVGTHPAFVAAIRELIEERMTANPVRRALGNRGPNHDICPLNCCVLGVQRPVAAAAAR